MQVPCPSGSRSDLERLLVQYYMYWKGRLCIISYRYIFFLFFFIWIFVLSWKEFKMCLFGMYRSQLDLQMSFYSKEYAQKLMYVYLHLNVATSENYSDITQLTLRFHVYRVQPSISLHATITCTLFLEQS